jgi:hypothetical protein
MTRVFTGQGPAYNQLLIGLTVLAVTVLGSAIWLGGILLSWSRKLARLQASLTARTDDLAALPLTGERELDRLWTRSMPPASVSVRRVAAPALPSGLPLSADWRPASRTKFAIPLRLCG